MKLRSYSSKALPVLIAVVTASSALAQPPTPAIEEAYLGAGLSLMLLGMAFMAAETFIPSFGIIGIGGVAAFVTGAIIMVNMEHMPSTALDPAVIWGVALLALLAVALTIFVTVKSYKKHATTGPEGLIGQKADIVEWSETQGRVRIQGEIWKAASDAVLDMRPDDPVLVESIDLDDLTLKITPL